MIADVIGGLVGLVLFAGIFGAAVMPFYILWLWLIRPIVIGPELTPTAQRRLDKARARRHDNEA
jgi:hypothetical protein